ncbi:MAG: hypothetical protein ACXV5Q_05465 [Frankiaceae bacterium]
MLVFAIISFGFLFAQSLALSNSARQAARYGVVQDRTCTDVITTAIEAAKPTVTLLTSDVVVKRGQTLASASSICGSGTTKPCAGSAATDNIYVSVSYSARVLIPVIPGMGSTTNLSGTGVFRCEWSTATS